MQLPQAKPVVRVERLEAQRQQSPVIGVKAEPLGLFWMHLCVIAEEVEAEVLEF